MAVAWTHYAPYSRPGFVVYSHVAVLLFYLTSGFYMSLVLAETYSDRPGRFYANRALRIFPPYYAALMIMTATILLGMNQSPQHFFPPDLRWIFDQFTVLPLVISRNLRLDMANEIMGLTMAQFYTVGLELMFYVLAPFTARLSTRTLIAMLPFALIAHFMPEFFGLPRRVWQYDFFPCVFVFFLMGCLSYRLYAATRWALPPRAGWLLMPAVILISVASPWGDWTDSFFPWAIYFTAMLGLPFLFVATSRSRFEKFDKWLGDQAYPLYLTHNSAVSIALATGTTGFVGVACFIGIATLLTVSIWFAIDRPVEWLRRRVKRPERRLSLAASAP